MLSLGLSYGFFEPNLEGKSFSSLTQIKVNFLLKFKRSTTSFLLMLVPVEAVLRILVLVRIQAFDKQDPT